MSQRRKALRERARRLAKDAAHDALRRATAHNDSAQAPGVGRLILDGGKITNAPEAWVFDSSGMGALLCAMERQLKV